jgi:hypothetical protein
MNADDVRRLLDKECKKAGGVADYARQIGVSYELVRATLTGAREPATSILSALGLERVVTYRRVR